MRTVQVTDLVRDVKIILNENIQNDPILTADLNQIELEELINGRIVDAVRSIHEAAPSEMLDDGLDITGLVQTYGGTGAGDHDGTGYVPLTDDFMRLVIFKLATWKRPVVMAIADTDPKYPMQKSRFLGVRGGVDKPICAITTGNSGKILEFFSVAPGTVAPVIEKAKYLPLPKIDNGAILVCTKLYTPIMYECAALVSLTFKDEIAKSFFEIAKSYL